MGGSGGGFFSGNVNFGELFDKVKQSQDETTRQACDSEVDKIIASILAGSRRDAEAVQNHLKEIIKQLSGDIDGTVDFIFGGSIAKHTYIDGLSDVDTLVILNNSELEDKTPNEVLGYFLDRLNGRFPNHEVTKGELAVTIKYSDVEVQLLPAVKMKTGVKIASPDGKGWVSIKPQNFKKDRKHSM